MPAVEESGLSWVVDVTPGGHEKSLPAPPEADMPKVSKKKLASNKDVVKKYERPVKDIPIRKINDKKLKGNLRKSEKKTKEAMERAAQSELLLTEESG